MLELTQDELKLLAQLFYKVTASLQNARELIPLQEKILAKIIPEAPIQAEPVQTVS